MNIRRTVLILFTSLFALGCQEIQSLGNSIDGYHSVPENQIPVELAVELNMAEIEKIFDQRYPNSAENRNETVPARIYVAQQGGNYYIVKDYFPTKSLSEIEPHCVKVPVENVQGKT